MDHLTHHQASSELRWLIRLTEKLGVPCDPAAVSRRVDAARLEKSPDPEQVLEVLALAAKRSGLRVTPVEGDRQVALEPLNRDTPLLLRRNDGDYLLVSDQRSGRYEVIEAPDGEPRLVRVDELIELLDQVVEQGQVKGLRFHAAAPCEGAIKPASGPTPTPLTRLLAILQPDRQDLWAVLIFAVVIGGMLLATPIAVQSLVNFVAFGGAVAPVLVLAALLAVGLGFASALGALQAFSVELLQRRIFVRMVTDLSHRLPRVHRSTYDKAYGPELVNRFFDVITVQKMSSLLLLDGVSVVLGVLIGLLVLAFYHPLLLVFDLILIAMIFAIVFLLGRSGVTTAISESKTKYAMASWLEDVARSPITFKHPAARDYVLQRSDELARGYVRARRTHYRVLFRQIIAMLTLQVLASVALLGIGGALVIRGELTLGQLVAAELIVTYVVGSIAKMGKHFESFYDLMAATDKLGNLLDLRLERKTGDSWSRPENLDPMGAEIRIRDIAIHSSSKRKLVRGLSLDVRPGERIGIKGPSGSGKSRLAEMLFGSVVPESGSIEIDGIDLRAFRLETLRQQVAMVSGPEVFQGTIRENVLLGRALAAEDLHDALRKTGLLRTFTTLPLGLDTPLTSKGQPLSHSEILRLMLARAISQKPRLLLVDGTLEPMSSRGIERALSALCGENCPWTLVIVSNREEVLRRCDRVLDLTESIEAEEVYAS